jgi:hypothetical protein
VALCSPLSDFSFQLFSFSAFAEMWLCAALFLISAFSFQHFSFSAFAQLWLCAALFPISAFSITAFQLLPNCGFVQPSFRFQLSAFSISAFAQLWLWGGFPAQSRITNHESPPAFGGLARPFDVGCWMLDVRCSG